MRAGSFHTEEIPYEQHQKWYEQKRKNENSRIYILEDIGAPVGQVRADRDERGESAEISYALQMRARGKGLCVVDACGRRGAAFGKRILQRIACGSKE